MTRILEILIETSVAYGYMYKAGTIGKCINEMFNMICRQLKNCRSEKIGTPPITITYHQKKMLFTLKK